MLSMVTKIGMVLCFITFFAFDMIDWFGPLFGENEFLAEAYGMPETTEFPTGFLIFGWILSVIGIVALFFGFRSIWRILNGGKEQDFRLLAQNLKVLGISLIVVWFTSYLRGTPIETYLHGGFEIGAAELISLDIISGELLFFIIAVAILAISNTLERAWLAEDENKQFL